MALSSLFRFGIFLAAALFVVVLVLDLAGCARPGSESPAYWGSPAKEIK